MKRLLILSPVIEPGAGLALLCCPIAAARLLLGSPLDAPDAVALGRLAGAAVLALGVANWRAYYDAQSCAARGVVAGMVLYNFGAAAVLGTAGLDLRPAGIALWPAVVLHAAMMIWCVRGCLRNPDGLEEAN